MVRLRGLIGAGVKAMDLIDLGLKLGLSGTTLLFFFLFLWEQRRHDATREKYSVFLKEREEKERELTRERMAIDKDRIAADLNEAKVLAQLVTMLQMGSRNG